MIQLRKKNPQDRKIAIILYDFPPGYGATGTAALLNVPRSLLKVLQALKEQGYFIGELPEDGEALIEKIKQIDESVSRAEIEEKSVTVRTLEKWLGYLLTSRIEKQWKSLTSAGIKTYENMFYLGGLQL